MTKIEIAGAKPKSILSLVGTFGPIWGMKIYSLDFEKLQSDYGSKC